MKTPERTNSTTHSAIAQNSLFTAIPFFQPKVQRMPAFESEATVPVQAKLSIGQPGDAYEQEADRVASQVVNQIHAPETAQSPQRQSIQRQEDPKEELQTKPILQRREVNGGGEASTEVSAAIDQARGGGQPLDPNLQQSIGQAMGADFSGVRVHTDSQADQLNQSLQAKAFTTGQDVFFRQGEYNPASSSGKELLAHELTHVVQQTGGSQDKPVQMKSLAIQRKLELRPPGKGEASAFDRAQELVDRLNTVSPAIQYELKGQALVYTVKDITALTHFDTVMKGFIDRAELVPMRLITGKGYVGGGPLFADSFISAYVDLDDLLTDDIYSFQSDLLHFLTERFQVKDYARLIGTDLSAQFPKAHRAGKDAEAAQLQALFNDSSIVFLYEETKPNNTWVNAFKSKDHGYRVFQVVRHFNREVAGGEMWVQKLDGKRVSIDEFRKERAAVAP